MEYVLAFLIGTVIYALCLWGGSKMLGLNAHIGGAFLMAAIAGALGMIPAVGGLLSMAALAVIIQYKMEVDFVPVGIAMVFVAGLLRGGEKGHC